MRRIFKHAAATLLVPLTKWYLRKERTYRRDGITILVRPGVFHPGLFSSTDFLAESLARINLENKTFLELGCGTGFLSIAAARRGAKITASDFSLTAVENTRLNAAMNNVQIQVVHADLFNGIPPGSFDVIAINPPYYARRPENEEELAWHCGEDFEYFLKLFGQLGQFMHDDSTVLMVLTMGCDIERILSIAKENGFEFDLLKEKWVLFDGKDFLYRIRNVSPHSALLPHRTEFT